ncbi:MAG: hypothetical protein K0T99_01675 [Alphaproteobacteria bacterium]|nr:hypothetical protein [Alphaproteobacteria bacterium]
MYSVVAWEFLSKNPNAYLIDVRTPEEWEHIGIPDLSSIGKKVKLISWMKDLEGNKNENFIKELESNIPDKEDMLIFICRSGVRSLNAAKHACSHGYKSCFNIQDGFEGNNNNEGWKNSNLAYTV